MPFATLFKATTTPTKRGRRKKEGTLPKEPKRIKKVVQHKDKAKEIIDKSFTKAGKPKMPKHVMKVNDWIYITCDAHCFKIMEVNDKVNKDGDKLPDKPLLYAPHLDQIIEVLAHHMTREVPMDLIELHEQLDHIREIIMDRIPPNIKPKDLFADVSDADEGD